MAAAPYLAEPGRGELDRFRARVLADPALQEKLSGIDDSDVFLARAIDTARELGFALDAEIVQTATHRPLPEMYLYFENILEVPAAPRGWLPTGSFWRQGRLLLHWTYFGARRLTEPFFGASVNGALARPFARFFRCATPIERLPEWLQRHPHLQPSGLIFHMSRCGSTLAAQMLAALPSNIMVSEAGVIDELLRADSGVPAIGGEHHALWLNAVIAALGCKRTGDERHHIVKLDAWHTAALPLFRRAFPATPWVFFYRDPVEVLVSQLQMPGTQMILSEGAGSREEHYARVLAGICHPVEREFANGGGLLINYRELPDAVWTRILPHFGIACSDADRRVMQQAAEFDAKVPGVRFIPDSGAKQQAATERARLAAEQWLGDIYRRLEVLPGQGRRSEQHRNKE